MSRLQALGNLLQVAVCAALCAAALPRWMPAATVAGAMAVAQLAAAALVLAGRERDLRRASALTVLLGGLLLGMLLQGAVHTWTAYGSDATRMGQLAVAVILLASPWVLAWPLWQWLRGRRPGPESTRGLAVLLAAGGLAAVPGVARALTTRPAETWPAQPDLQVASEAAFLRWTGQQATLPAGEGPAVVLLTPWSEGVPGRTVAGRGDSLDAALEQALALVEAPGPRPGLVVDLARERWAPGSLVGAGWSGALAEQGGTSPTTLVQGGGVRWAEVLPELKVPVPKLDEDAVPARFDSVLAWADGSAPLVLGWPEAPRLDPDVVLASTIAAGDYLLRHQKENGRFGYVVQGPSGLPGSGYNYPRHAGVTWFLARLYQRTGEERFAEGARRGLAYLEAQSAWSADRSRAWVRDARRQDGLAWAGTTALGALGAAIVAPDEPLTHAWGAQLAAVVDEQGAVRGNFDVRTGEARWSQPLNPYGQGQVTLALAALVRAGHADLRPVTERAGRFLDGDYAPGAAGRLVVLDEHWTCIAASTLRDVLGTPHGLGVCRGYLAQSSLQTPSSGSPLSMASGPGGGQAEAVVAGAFLEPDAPWAAQALQYGQLFLDSQYRSEDAALLPRPLALLGAYRDRPWQLDVQMDAVQHIGCALLGVEELLRGQPVPGARP